MFIKVVFHIGINIHVYTELDLDVCCCFVYTLFFSKMLILMCIMKGLIIA